MAIYYSIPAGNVFVSKAEIFFEELITKYKYVIAKSEIKKHSALIVYNNETHSRTIEIKNETNYTDYGFSIFLYNTQNNEFNIVVNVPFDKQDKECEILKVSAEFFFVNMEKLIVGIEWKKIRENINAKIVISHLSTFTRRFHERVLARK